MLEAVIIVKRYASKSGMGKVKKHLVTCPATGKYMDLRQCVKCGAHGGFNDRLNIHCKGGEVLLCT